MGQIKSSNAGHSKSDRKLTGNVLVLGGGPAGTWAAISAVREGASVILADKGFCGTSGATAPSGTGVWYVPPDPEARRQARDSRDALGGYLADHRWVHRVLDQTYSAVNELGAWGYPFPKDPHGRPQRRSLQGPEYMRLMRKQVQRAGVQILDHSPALELLTDAEGRVAGAAGINRQTGERWTVEAGAVVVATGGCAFLSKALGCNVLTGDGYLFAAEAGADLSGMEFSNAYGLAPAFSSVTKGLFYNWANFYYEDGTEIEGSGAHQGRSAIARTLLSQPVYARLDRATDDMRAWMRAAQPNFFLPFDRLGIDPFTQLFPVTLRLEGTVRGTGGIRIVDDQCATTVPGLYAAGDAATREPICGAFTGGGSHNAAWAISSGIWAGQGAARHARRHPGKQLRLIHLGEAGLQPQAAGLSGLTAPEAVAAVQAEVFPFEKNLFRTGQVLSESLRKLDGLWKNIRRGLAPADPLRAREAAAMAATARWMYASALARTESRGMHKREDYPERDPRLHHRLISSGLDQVQVRPEAVERAEEALAS